MDTDTDNCRFNNNGSCLFYMCIASTLRFAIQNLKFILQNSDKDRYCMIDYKTKQSLKMIIKDLEGLGDFE